MKKPNLNLKKPDLNLKRLRADLRLPKLGGGRISAPKTSIKAPKFATDLYGDLRDRRLLPLIALLLVAILAVPFLLGGDDEEAPPVATPAQSSNPADSTSASFSVVPAEPGLRVPDKRLGYRQARDPFQRPVRTQKEPSGDSGSGSSGGSTATGAAATTPSNGAAQTNTTKTNIVVESDVTDWGIDIRSGFVDGPEKDRSNLPAMTSLPNEKNPAVVFVGLSGDRQGAMFLMTSEVTAYYGKGKCAVDKQACQLLELRPGQAATFAIGYGQTRYKIFLKRIVALVETHTEDAGTITTSK
jgi:hypothetical protein